MPDIDARVVRRAARTLVMGPLVLLPLMPVAAAYAAPPEAWPTTEPVSALDFLMVLLVIPLALALVITVLSSVPSMVRGQKYTPGLAWRNEDQWFGGPQDGLEAADKKDPQAVAADASERGGASGRW